MENFEEKLNSLLSNPEAMGQIMQLAQSLGGGESPPPPPIQQQPSRPPMGNGLGDVSSLLGSFDPAMLSRMMGLLQEWNRPQSGQTAALLTALQPFLKEERRNKVGQAIRLSRMIHLGKQFFKGEG